MNKSIILGTIPVKQFLYDELEALVLPSSILLEASLDETEMPSDPRFQIAQLMDGFVRRFSQVYPPAPVSCLCAKYDTAVRRYFSECLSQPLSYSPDRMSHHCGLG
jgi:hypothetical protein